MRRFRGFLLNEEKGHLGHKVNSVLTGMQDIQTDMGNIGSRHLNRLAEEIVNQIRKILHSNWTQKNHKYLIDLQKIGVAIMKTIEEKGDLKDVLPSATQELQNLAGKLGVKVNNLEAPEIPGKDIDQDDFEMTGDGTSQPEQPQQPMQTQGDPMMQDPAQQMPPQDPMMQNPMDQQMPMQ